MYKQGKRDMYGHRFPDGMRENQKLPATIITPTSKAYDGAHDEPMTEAEILGKKLLNEAQWREDRKSTRLNSSHT